MEQSLQVNADSIPKSVRIKQNIAAWLFVITNIYWLFTILVGNIFYYIIPSDIIEYFLPNNNTFHVYSILQSAIIGILNIICWIILLSIVSNKATKVATILGISLLLINIVFRIIELFNTDITIFFSILIQLLWIYVYSTIIQANNIEKCDKTWISIMIINRIIAFSLLFNRIIFFAKIDNLENYQGDLFAFNFQYGNSLLLFWSFIFQILILIAEYRFARCIAFAGSYDPTPAPSKLYSPINKYFTAVLISATIASVLWTILYSNIESLESILN